MNLSGLHLWHGCFDGLQEAVWLVDANSHLVLFANAAAARLTLQSAGDFVGKNVLDIAGTPQDLAFWNETSEVIAQGIDSVSSLLRSDGVLLSVERRISTCSFSDTESVLMMSMVDRSAQQAVKKELESSLAQLSATLDSAADGMLVCGLDGSVHDVNRQLAKIWKMPSSLLIQHDDDGIHAFMALSVLNPTAYTQRLSLLAHTPDASSTDLIALCDGRTLERRSVPQVCQGTVIGRVFSFRDVTAELADQADMRIAGQVFECSTDAIFIANSQHQLVQLNPAGESLFGQVLQELRGRKVMELLMTSPAHSDLAAQAHVAWAHNNVWRSEVAVARPSGTRAVHLTWVAVRDANGKVDKSIGFLRDLTEQHAAQQQIYALAYTDSLTALPNRLLLKQRVTNTLQTVTAGTARFAVLYLGLDRFKTINNSLGHGFGDRVLQLVAARLQSTLRPADILCRLRADEFVIYLHECSRGLAESVARHVVDNMGRPFMLDGIGFSIQCSIGVATCPQDGQTLDELVKHADLAMYRVKGQGGGRHGFYQPEMNAALLERMQMEHSLRQALQHGHMTVHYQPQLKLGSNQIVGAEALLRWSDPALGLVSPAVFIPLAEETGYIVTLGAWVLEQAVKQAACWMRTGLSITVSVNVSALEFRQPDFVERLMDLLELHGLPGGLLELELTESILLQDAQEAAQKLATLAASGVALAIDDFGTGYSNLAYLKNLPIHKLKVDQSFVRGLPEDGGDHAIVSAIVHMGHALHMRVVAEGVETLEQRAVLQSLGCDYFQGFLCSPALAPADFSVLLANKNALLLDTIEALNLR